MRVSSNWLVSVELCLMSNEDLLKFWDLSLSTKDQKHFLLPSDIHDGRLEFYSMVCLNNQFLAENPYRTFL